MAQNDSEFIVLQSFIPHSVTSVVSSLMLLNTLLDDVTIL